MEREERLDQDLQCSGSLGAGLGFNPKSSGKSSKGFVLACRILVPLPEIEPVLLQWNHGFLTTGSPGKSIRCLFENISIRPPFMTMTALTSSKGASAMSNSLQSCEP